MCRAASDRRDGSQRFIASSRIPVVENSESVTMSSVAQAARLSPVLVRWFVVTSSTCPIEQASRLLYVDFDLDFFYSNCDIPHPF